MRSKRPSDRPASNVRCSLWKSCNPASPPIGTFTRSPKMSDPKMKFDPETIRKDFPILGRTIQGKPLIYLDNTATTQKPKQDIDPIMSYYERSNANVHR